MAIINFKDSTDFISYLLKHRNFFNATDHLVFEFDFNLQEFLKYFSSSNIPSKVKDLRLANVYFKKSACFSALDSSLEFRSLTIKDCFCDQGIKLNNLHIYGELRLDTSHSFDFIFENSIVDGSCTIAMSDSSVKSDIQFHNIAINKHLTFNFNTKDQKLLKTIGTFNLSNPNSHLLCTNSSVLITPLILKTKIHGNISINVKSMKVNDTPVDISTFPNFTHISSNNGILIDLVISDSTIDGNINCNTHTIGSKKAVDISRLKDIPNNKYLAMNSAIISVIDMHHSIIKGTIQNMARIDQSYKNPYTICNNKCLTANSGIIAQSIIDKTIMQKFTTDIRPNIPNLTHGELFFHTKEDFQKYLKENLKREQPIIIGQNDHYISLEFNFILDEFYSFLTDVLSLSITNLSFLNIKFKKKLIFSNTKNIQLALNNCQISQQIPTIFSKIVAENIYFNCYNNNP